MFNGQSGNTKGGGIQKATAAIGAALGLAVALLATPVLFELTRNPLYAYFFRYFPDRDIALGLMWLFGAIEAFLVFAFSNLIFTAILMYLFAALAVRSLRG